MGTFEKNVPEEKQVQRSWGECAFRKIEESEGGQWGPKQGQGGKLGWRGTRQLGQRV